MSARPLPVAGWLPIESAPLDGTSVLLLFPGGRVDIGRWVHIVRTENGMVEQDHADWRVRTPLVFVMSKQPSPTHWMQIPAPPPEVT